MRILRGKVSNMCVSINLKIYSGIQEINFLLLLNFFLSFFWLKGLFLSCMWFLLCFAEENMKDTDGCV